MERDLRIAVFGQKRLSREGGVEIVVKELCHSGAELFDNDLYSTFSR